MKVLKFGGTSVGSAPAMRNMVERISAEEKQWVVLSAVAGTTDLLVEVEHQWRLQHCKQLSAGIKKVRATFARFIFELFEDSDAFEDARLFLEEKVGVLSSLTAQPWSRGEGNLLIAHGELISTGLFCHFLRSRSVPVTCVPATGLIRKNRDQSVDMTHLRQQVSAVVSGHPETKVFITQGFICLDHEGRPDNLGRGGSDYTATLLGNVLEAAEVQIWTDVDGMHNNDPRVVTGTTSVSHLSYDEADELAYFGAKVLYPRCVFPAKQKNIPIRILYTMNPEAPGTVISNRHTAGNIKAVAGKEGITAIRIRSGRMLMAYGFLKKVFEVFEQYETPIDMITTSEVSVSLSIDDNRNLTQIVNMLKKLGEVEVETGQSVVCVVGDFMAQRKGVVRQVLEALEDIPLRMISYGGSMNNVSLLLSSSDKKRAMEALHRYFFINQHSHVV